MKKRLAAQFGYWRSVRTHDWDSPAHISNRSYLWLIAAFWLAFMQNLWAVRGVMHGLSSFGAWACAMAWLHYADRDYRAVRRRRNKALTDVMVTMLETWEETDPLKRPKEDG